MTIAARADVGAIVIGRNEGPRLLACLASLGPISTRSVYVDSGSTDGSVAAAEAAGLLAVVLPDDVPFTAARARNAGVAALTTDGRGAGLRYIQFIDGDCTLSPGWLETAADFLDGHADTAVVCGRRRERYPEASLYNRLCDMEWNTPIGEAAACGGDTLMRREAFEAVRGFDPRLIAGEEPELCLRLRRAGWRIWRLDAEMTAHDAAIHRFGQWWRRCLRGGWAYAEGAAMHGSGPERYRRREARSILVWGAALPIGAATAAGLAAAGLSGAAWAAAGIVALYPAMATRVALDRRRRFGDPWPDALAYGGFVMLGKLAQAHGALRFLRQGRGQARLIEYKGAGA